MKINFMYESDTGSGVFSEYGFSDDRIPEAGSTPSKGTGGEYTNTRFVGISPDTAKSGIVSETNSNIKYVIKF